MDDLIGEFITETSESLSVLDLELVKLEKNPNDTAILGNIFRLVHTIKGTCGFLGLPRLESVAHASENVLGKIRDKVIAVTPTAISLVLQSLDCIKAIVEYLTNNGKEPEGDDKELIAKLNRFAESNGADAGDGAAPAAAPAAAPQPEAVVDFTPVAAVPETQAAPPPPAKKEEPNIAAQAKEQAITQGLAATAAEPKDGGGAGAATQSIRVTIDVLENLMQMVSELVLTRNQLMQIARTRGDKVFMSPLQQLSLITTELQEGIMKTRMQPIGNAWSKFPRLIRDLSMELNKKIELKMIGAETELDRQLLEMIKDPLTHMVRNSCDHGLETGEQRIAAGKPELGTVTLSAYHEGGHIIIEIADDGRGINLTRVKEKAITNGLATQAEIDQMTDQQICQFIFRAGFSTAEKVTSVSGRGVGMDVVRTNIEKIGGTIELNSVFGKGSTFHIKIPLTLAIVSVLIIEAGGEQFAIPQINVLELVRVSNDSEHKIELIKDAPVLRLRDKLLPLMSLGRVLGIDEEKPATETGETFVVVCKVGSSDFGLIVDRVFDTEEIVVKPVSTLLKEISVYSGNTILGDGSVIMILDPGGLSKAVGELDTSSQSEVADKKRTTVHEAKESFLLCRAGKGAPKAIPLELVSRLEEIDTSKIELSGEYPVVQYRGDLMRLVTLNNDYQIASVPMREVVVFSYDNKVLGLAVEEILDIVEEKLSVKTISKEPGFLGSMVIHGKTTDVVDVGDLLRDLIDKNEIRDAAGMKENSNTHILFVEDSMFFRNITAPFLTSMGYKVSTAVNGVEGLRLLDKGDINLIITDIEMPEMDGFAFTQACRSIAKFKHLPVIAFTSTINQQLVERAEAVGIKEYITKTDPEGLVRAIDRAVQQERVTA